MSHTARSHGVPRVWRVVRVTLGVAGGGALVVVAAVFVLANTPWGNERVRRLVVSQANNRLYGELTIGTLRGNLLRGATLTDVSLLDSAKRPLFSSRRVELAYALMPALRGHVVIRAVELDTPFVLMDKRPGARWNFQSLMRPSTTAKDTTQKSAPPEIADITIRHGRFFYRRPWSPDSTLSAAAQDSAIASVLRPDARKRTDRVSGGFQRVLDYHDIDAHLPAVRIAHAGLPTSVQIGRLSMLAEPYRPPAIDVRSLTGTLLVSKDSLWWRGAHMLLPSSNVSGDGTIGFHHSGFLLDLVGAPVAVADLRWLDPKLAPEGGGRVHYTMSFRGDTSTFTVADADLHYREASLTGGGTVSRVASKGQRSELLIRGVDATIAHLSTGILHELAPSVPVRRTGIFDGHIVASGQAKALALNADVSFDDAAAGRSCVTARGGLGLEHGVQANALVVRLRPLYVATVSGLGVQLPLGGVVTGNATVTGSTRAGWMVRGDLTHVQSGARSRIAGTGRYQVAGKHIVADATLLPLSLVTVGRFVPSAQLRGDVTGKVHAEGTTKDLRLAGTLHSARDGGVFDARGTVTLDGSHSRYDVAVVMDSVNAHSFSRKAPRTRFTGAASARGTGFSAATANATINADLAHSHYDTFAVETVRARLAAANGLLRVDTLGVLASGVRANASGSFGLTATQNGTLKFSADVDSLGLLRRWLGANDTGSAAAPAARQRALVLAARADSARRAEAVRIEQLALGLPLGVSLAVDTLPPIRRDSLAGRVTAAGTLRGNVNQVGIDATIRGTSIIARGNSVRHVTATVASANVKERSIPVFFSIDADSVESTGRAFDRVLADGHWQDSRIDGDLRIRQDSLVSYAAAGYYAKPDSGVHVVHLDSLRATFDTLVWRLARPGTARIDNGSYAVDSLDLRSSAGGRLFADGAVPEYGAVHLDVLADNVRISTVLTALQRDPVADGILAGQVRVDGRREVPVMTGRASLRSASYRDTHAPDVDATAGYRDHRLSLDAMATDSTGRRVAVAAATLPFDLALLNVSGSRRLDGPVLADVTLDSLAIQALPIQSRAIDGLGGSLAADAHMRGTWRVPTFTGDAALRGGRMTLVATEMRIANAVADMHLAGDTLRLDSLVARAHGPLRASGTVDFTDRSHPFVNMSAIGRDVRVMDQFRGLVDADAEISARGPLDSVRVTGRGDMKGGFLALKQFRKDLLRVKAPGDLSFLAVFDTTAPPGDSADFATLLAQPRRFAVIADLSLVVSRGNYYRNRPDANTEFYTGEGEEVRAHLDQRTSDSWAAGFVHVGQGVAFFRTRPFTPAKGTLTFGPHTGAPAIVQQVGERMLWEPGRGWFPLQLLTGGTSKAPSIGLESGSLFPVRGRELNGYLTIGRASTSLLQQSGSSLSGSETWSGQLGGESGALARRQQAATALGVVFHDIGVGASKEYGLDAFSVSPADVPTELVFGKTGGVRGALVEAGHYVTTDRYIGGELRLTTGIPGVRIAQQFGTTYRFDAGIEPRFLFRAPEELGITHPTVRTGVFGMFLTRLWDF